ncbi:MAG: alkaline phosphatase family protein [Armatimonadota bacterium]
MTSGRRLRWWVLPLLFLLPLPLFLIRGGGMGAVLYLAVTITAGIVLQATWGLSRLWRGGRFRVLNGLRAIVLALFVLAGLGGWLYGGLSVYRFTSDRAELPIPDRYVAVIVVDGASLLQARELLYKGLDDKAQYDRAVGDAFPNISKYFLTGGSFTACGVSVWPSSSIPAHTGIVTGCYPRTTGVMGQRQFNAKERRYTSYIGLGILAHRTILERGVKTIGEWFPHVRSLDVVQVANRGCSLYVPSPPHDELAVRRLAQMLDLAGLFGKEEIPRIAVITLPDIDHLTHNSFVSDQKSIDLYLQTDRTVGEILDLYKSKGIFEKTLFVVVADHGMGEVRNHVTLDNLMHDMRFDTFQSFKWTAVPARGSFEANAWLGTRGRFDRVYNCVPLWGGNSDALLYVKGQQGTNTNWDIPVTDEMLQRYMVGGTEIDVIRRLLDYSPGIGLIFTNPQRDTYNVYGHGGQGQILERVEQGRREFSYRVISGNDPLEYAQHPATAPFVKSGAWLDDQAWLRLTYLSHYPDAVRRIAFSFGHPNAANLHIVAADDWDFTPYYVAKRVLVGSHGSLNAQQSLVPIMFHGPGIKRGELAYGRTVDILPTILAYFGQENANLDGRPLPVFADEDKNARLTAGTGCSASPPANGYCLEAPYASYDRRIVRYRDGKREVIIPSLRAAVPALRAQPNITAEYAGYQAPHLLLRVIYSGEQRADGLLQFNTATRKFE